MFRNKDIRLVFTAMILIGALAAMASFFFREIAWLIVIIATVCNITLISAYLRWRNQRIDQMSVYLQRVANGIYDIEIRDNYEGELSILKSEIYKVTMMLRNQSETLQQDKAFLADSISDISHQIKTPLTTIRMMVDLLENPELPTEKQELFVSSIAKSADRIQWLILTLLKIAKLDAGAIIFQRESFDMVELIDAAAEPFYYEMEKRNQSFHNDTETGAHITCDWNWTCEAVSNILKNAMEHTPDGGEIRVWVDVNPLWLELHISDNGLGMDKEELRHIFDRFYRGKNAKPDSIGIGLALSKSIIESQGGSVSVYSEKGSGSIFSLRFYDATTSVHNEETA